MKTLKTLVLLCLICTPASLLLAQSPLESMIADWERAKTYTKAYLDAIPEQGYAFQPTEQTRSFAGQMLHIADANYGFAAAASGTESPVAPGALEKSPDQSKAKVTDLVLKSYDFVIQALKDTPQGQLHENIKLFGQFEMTREAGFRKCFEHQTHHRGQTTIYLRLSGVKPPSEMLF